MKSTISEHIVNDAQRQNAQENLSRCVHCGFCNATCPTYRLLGDELDGPRGRIYQIKSVLEGAAVTASFQEHLDRCLTCRNCETTCPSGVKYGQLLDIGRAIASGSSAPKKHILYRLKRAVLLRTLPYPSRIAFGLRLAQWARPLCPKNLKANIPPRDKKTNAPSATSSRRQVVLPGGCVQSLSKTNTNASAARVLARLGIGTVEVPTQCCGAMAHHLNDTKRAHNQVQSNLKHWSQALNGGAEAIIATASGCGVMMKEYNQLLPENKAAQQVADNTKDLSEFINVEEIKPFIKKGLAPLSISYHPPCTLQHGQKVIGKVEVILAAIGCKLLPFHDQNQCCGSAGTYSIFQPKLSKQLIQQKVAALEKNQPDLIVTANIGCQLYIEANTQIPVKHWIEVLDERLEAV